VKNPIACIATKDGITDANLVLCARDMFNALQAVADGVLPRGLIDEMVRGSLAKVRGDAA
jgi:hypothetical protein